MLLIIVIAVIAIILIISNKKESKKTTGYNHKDDTVKTSGKLSFLSVIGLWLRNFTKGK